MFISVKLLWNNLYCIKCYKINETWLDNNHWYKYNSVIQGKINAAEVQKTKITANKASEEIQMKLLLMIIFICTWEALVCFQQRHRRTRLVSFRGCNWSRLWKINLWLCLCPYETPEQRNRRCSFPLSIRFSFPSGQPLSVQYRCHGNLWIPCEILIRTWPYFCPERR